MRNLELIDEGFIRLAFKEALKSLNSGNYPFGAILVKNNLVVAVSSDDSYSSFDPTGHAELNLIKLFCKEKKLHNLKDYVIYCSTEPCAMCSGAIHWAHIGRIVFSVSQNSLNKLSGVKEKMSCEKIINSCHRYHEIKGGVLEKEGLKLFKNFKLMPKDKKAKLY